MAVIRKRGGEARMKNWSVVVASDGRSGILEYLKKMVVMVVNNLTELESKNYLFDVIVITVTYL